MEPIQNTYPVFEANQVLTSGHLNELFDYLDEQNRLTRANLIGIGIVCGLDIKLTTDNGTKVITITKGCGITSDGYFIVIPDDMPLTSYRADYQAPSDYAAFRFAPDAIKPNDTVQYPLWELFPADEQNTVSLTTLNGSNNTPKLEDMAVLLFLELKKQSLRNCSMSNCDDKGSEVTAIVKPLLILKTDLDKIIAKEKALGSGLSSGELADNLMKQLNLPDIRLPRFDVPNTNPATTDNVLKAFQNVFTSKPNPNDTKTVADQIGDALRNSYSAFMPLLKDAYPDNPFSNYSPNLNQIIFYQYGCDYFDDLLQAYDEFRWKATRLICSCCPHDGLFSLHLMLGLLNPAAQSDLYRQNFLASPAVNRCSEHSKEVIHLFRRLVEMTRHFKPGIQKDIYITPSIMGDNPLSEKAIPCYYEQTGTPPLYELWNYEKTRRNRASQNLSYRFNDYKPTDKPVKDFVSNPLKYDFEPYNFLRIEGHLGQKYGDALNTLSTKVSESRLPIDVIALSTGNEASKNSLQNFLKNHPGVQHKAGVPLGGTFILVYHNDNPVQGIEKETVIADFYLPYRIAEPEIIQAVTVKECEYTWIDSIKHLNSICLRDYRFDKKPKARESDRNRLQNNYIIRIKKYEIQGTSLLNPGDNDISIPIKGTNSLSDYSLSAIAAELNATFPNGLVFDHEPGTNKIIIRFIEGQKFRIELHGLQGNMMKYAYDQDGMYRWQKKQWETLISKAGRGLSCRIVSGNYNAAEYQWLHKAFPQHQKSKYVGPTAKEVILWEQLTKARANYYNDVSKLPIFALLTEIYSIFLKIDDNIKVTLIGSWANGSWVSRNQDNNKVIAPQKYPKFGQITWEAFLNLRNKVTGKTGTSNIDLMIDSNHEIKPELLESLTSYLSALSQYKINIISGNTDSQRWLKMESKRVIIELPSNKELP